MWKKAQVSKQPFGASGKESPANCRRIERCEFDPWVRKIPGEGHVNPLQCSCLENSLHRGAWQPAVHGATKSQTRLSMHACKDVHTVFSPFSVVKVA